MENENKKPKVLNMNELVNELDDRSPVSRPQASQNVQGYQYTQERPAQSPRPAQTDVPQRTNIPRAQRVATGMRTAHRAATGADGSKVQRTMITLGGTPASAPSSSSQTSQKSSPSSRPSGGKVQTAQKRNSVSQKTPASGTRRKQEAPTPARKTVTRSENVPVRRSAVPEDTSQVKRSAPKSDSSIYHSSSVDEIIADTARIQKRNMEEARAKAAGRDSAPVTRSSSGTRNRSTSPVKRFDDIVNERRAAESGSSAQRRRPAGKAVSDQKPKSGKGFKKFILIYSAILLGILIIGSVVLYAFLHSYESHQPANIAAEVVGHYASVDKLKTFISKNSDKVNCLEDMDTLAAAYASSVDGKEISFRENNEYREDAPSFDITANGETMAKITIVSNGKGSFGLRNWELDDFNFVDYIPNTKSFDILVPEGSTVTVNNIELTDKYITGEGVPDVLANSTPYIQDTPTFTTYTISGLTKEPTVSAKDASGSPLTFQTSETTYLGGGNVDTAFFDEVDPLVQAGIKAWGLYFINMDSSLSYYIVQGCDLYTYIFGSEEMDPILTWLYNFEDINTYDFDYIEATNYVRYTDDCFTVDVKYSLSLTFTNASMSDDNQNLDATWVWVRDGDSWSISDMIYH